MLKVPPGSQTNGPEQVANILTTNSVITKDLSLFNSVNGGSQVIHGNLLTLPIGNAFLYVEPLYVQASSGNAAFPTLQRVLVSYGDKTGYADNLTAAIYNLDHGAVGASISNPGSPTGSSGGSPKSPAPSGSASSAPPSPSSSAPSTTPPVVGPPKSTEVPVSVAAILAELGTAFTQLDKAYASGDPIQVGAAEARLKALSAEYQKALAAQHSTPARTPAPTAKATPSR